MKERTIEKPGWKLKLSLKNPSGKKKVEALEDVVLNGTPDDIRVFMEKYAPFELTARALALAGRYRGIEHVRALMECGASFDYYTVPLEPCSYSGETADTTFSADPALDSRYHMHQKTVTGTYRTEYYLMLVPNKLYICPEEYLEEADCWIEGEYFYQYTPLCGVDQMELRPEMEEHVVPLDERVEITKLIHADKTQKVSLDEMLLTALESGSFEFADKLMELGADLDTTPPNHYDPYRYYTFRKGRTYLDILTSGENCVYWKNYAGPIAMADPGLILPFFTRLCALAAKKGKKPLITQAMFDSVKWTEEALAFIIKNCDCSKLNKKKSLENAISGRNIAALNVMAEAGWLKDGARREGVIEYASKNGHAEALAFLMDYKNRTVDIAAEAEKERKKLMSSLDEKPRKPSATQQNWSYEKLPDGTIRIKSYKGSDTEIVIPAAIGKAPVTVIGEKAFSANRYSGRIPKNLQDRRKITSIIVPEGVTEIEEYAFSYLEALKKIVLPESLKKLGSAAFCGCTELEGLVLPAGTTEIGLSAFERCKKLRDDGGFVIFNSILFCFDCGRETCTIPAGVKTIEREAASLGCRNIKTIFLPEGAERIGSSAFGACICLEDIHIPASVTKIGETPFSGVYRSIRPNGELRVHTPEGSPAEELLRERYGEELTILHDYRYE